MTVELFGRTRGEGPWLVMLHGLFGSGDNLGGIARILSEHYKILLLDLRNHGRSPHAVEMSYEAMAEDVLAAMDREGIQSAHIFGHSMGGKVAMQLALMAPKRLKALVVGDIAPVQYGDNHGRILEGMQAVAAAAPQSRQEAQALMAEFENEPGVLSFLMTNWRKNDDGIWGWRVNLSAIVSRYADIAAGAEGTAFKGPVLFLRGENSDYVQADHKDKILALFPAAAVKTISGTGHWLHAEKPDMVARSMLRFFEQAEIS
ncbi:MAG: alpha/beta fold hydrolase [Kordiimonadaceae bacterium]|nr:alpha/beta fold hydrolase [Kordiimonadaceae bacterium]MBO6569103.1 alpha/beta fold hydrolase [Kordiimonadaceae bacterium]MBO6964578.1 alpha/beta fold hydrolase [Kordiimonadaceae bacterium]